MKRNILLTILGVLLIVSAGCEKIIEIDIPDKDRKVVVNSLITPDSLVVVNLSKSLMILDPDTFVFLDNARVWLSRGEEKVGDLQYAGLGNYVLPGFFPKAGEIYRLDVEYQGLESAWATTSIPNPVSINSVDTSSIIDEWGSKEIHAKLSFTDPAEGTNYYAVVLYATTKRMDFVTGQLLDEKETNPVYFYLNESESETPAPDFGEKIYFGGKLLFDDRLFNGRERTLDMVMSSYQFYMVDTIWLDFRLEQIEESYYLYAASSQKYQQTFRNPFGEPVQVYNNVEGGFGIFSGYAASSYQMIMLGESGK